MGFLTNLFASPVARRVAQLIEAGDSRDRGQKVEAEVLALGGKATPHLAHIALRFDLQRWISNPDTDSPQGREYRAAQAALHIAKQIGVPFDDRTASKLTEKFVRPGLGGKANLESWGGLWSDASQALEGLGHIKLTP